MLHVAYDYNNDPNELAARREMERIVCNPVEMSADDLERKRRRKERIRKEAMERAGDVLEIERYGVTHYIHVANRNRH